MKHSPRIVSPRVEALLEAKVCNLIEPNQNYWNSEVIDSTMLHFEAEIQGRSQNLKLGGAALLLVVCSDFGFRFHCYLVA